jgi:integrase
LIGLECADYNPDSATLHIRRSKTGEARHVVLTSDGAAFFAQVCAGRAGSERMFARADGQAWMPSQQARPLLEANQRAKIDPPITFHGLRHCWASLAIMNGTPLLVVAKNLGHSDGRMVEKHYGHLSQSFIADAIRAGAPKFGPVRERKVVALA